MKKTVWLLLASAAMSSSWATAQTAASDPAAAQVATAPATTTTPAPDDCCRIAAGTPVELEIVDPLSSADRKRGDRFAIRLHTALRRGDAIVIPAGTVGVGEIVHGERSRGGGKPGELLLAARYLELDGVQVPLRALKFGGQGQDKTNAALGTAFVLGPFAHFIHGREIEIPAGTVVTAKLAQDLPIAASTAPTAADSPASTTTATQE
jgi:hypothetical protein